MPIVVVFDFPGEPVSKYHDVFERGDTARINNQPARLSHVCYETDTGFTVVDLWRDEASFGAFGEILGPAIAAAGLNPTPAVHRAAGWISPTGERLRW